jgi:hypothetical protein
MASTPVYDPDLLNMIEEIAGVDAQKLLESLEGNGYRVEPIGATDEEMLAHVMAMGASIAPIWDQATGMRRQLVDEQGWSEEAAELMVIQWVEAVFETMKAQAKNEITGGGGHAA